MAEFSAFDEPYDPYNRPNDQPTPPGSGGPIDLAPPVPPAPTGGSIFTAYPQTSPGSGGPKLGGGGGGATGTGDFGPQFDFSAFPRFNPVHREFTPLTLEQARNEPGYAFAEQQGQQGIERSAAARGSLRTGGTLKDIGTWIHDFATRNYGDANQRELNRFATNYQVEKDQYAPILAEAQSKFGAELQRGLAKYNRGTLWNNPNSGGGGGGGGGDGLLSYEEWKKRNGFPA